MLFGSHGKSTQVSLDDPRWSISIAETEQLYLLEATLLRISNWTRSQSKYRGHWVSSLLSGVEEELQNGVHGMVLGAMVGYDQP